MNILFIYSLDQIVSFEKPLYSYDQIQFGISYISALLKKWGHNTSLIILSKIYEKKSKKRVDDYIRKHKPKLICFTSVATEYNYIASVAKYIKQHYPHIFLFIGGPHVSLNPLQVMSDHFDALCVGEGEYPTVDLVRLLESKSTLKSIPNIWFKMPNGTIQQSTPRPFNKQLDRLPFPDRDMWSKWIQMSTASKLSILLGRGCPYNCSYCSNHALRKITTGQYVRTRSISNIEKELQYLNKKYPTIRNIHLEIETIGVDQQWTLNLTKVIRRLVANEITKPVFSLNLRIIPNTNYTDLFQSLSKANINILLIGLESGSERIRKKILRRHYSNNDLIKTIRVARKFGLLVYFYNLIGIPGETYNDFKKTVEINRICQPDDHMTSIFFPYPGTDLYDLCIRKKFIKNKLDCKMERTKAVLEMPKFTKRQIETAYLFFDYYVYNGHMEPLGILFRVFKNICNGSPVLYPLMKKAQIFFWRFGFKNIIKETISPYPKKNIQLLHSNSKSHYAK